MFLSMCLEIKGFRKKFPGYSTVPDSKINNSMEMTLIFQVNISPLNIIKIHKIQVLIFFNIK